MANVPTQAGPVPDKLTIWPMDDGRYGLDATFQGASGYERAGRHKTSLEAGGVRHSFRQELGGAWTLRFRTPERRRRQRGAEGIRSVGAKRPLSAACLRRPSPFAP
jgi:hypothetical protein